MNGGAVAAVDLGASGGRVVVGEVSPDRLALEVVHRFANEPVALPDGLHWDVLRIHHEILRGLRHAIGGGAALASVGVDSWGVDYALLDERDELVANPYHYRDARTADAVDLVHDVIPREELYTRTGLQFLPFNTIYQLTADQAAGRLATAWSMLLIPDLFAYWLSGQPATELTNASTTGLVDAATGTWAWDLIDRLGFPRGLFRAASPPGTSLGPIRGSALDGLGRPGASTIVTLVGSHDTASAVVAVPAEGDRFGYISSGTWSLVGVELPAPILSDASRAANFTNEAGVDGRVRYLHNVMGLWLLQESMRAWGLADDSGQLDDLLDAAGREPAGGPVIDPDDPDFLPPGDMPARIEGACARLEQPVPRSRPALVRCILDSLAAAYARALDNASGLSGQAIDVIHVVGGGARNELLCQLTADASGRPVIAGPVEATAIGNVLVQARALGFVNGDLETLRELVRRHQPLRRFEPRGAIAAPRS